MGFMCDTGKKHNYKYGTDEKTWSISLAKGIHIATDNGFIFSHSRHCKIFLAEED